MKDIFLYNGPIELGLDIEFIKEIEKHKNSEHVVVVLVTYGGSPHVAYKIGRYLQDKYESVSFFNIWVLQKCRDTIGCSGSRNYFRAIW